MIKLNAKIAFLEYFFGDVSHSEVLFFDYN